MGWEGGPEETALQVASKAAGSEVERRKGTAEATRGQTLRDIFREHCDGIQSTGDFSVGRKFRNVCRGRMEEELKRQAAEAGLQLCGRWIAKVRTTAQPSLDS